MARKKAAKTAGRKRTAQREQVSAGGVACRREPDGVKVALILVGESARWQLPKGHVDAGETTEQAALREVREETGIEAELLGPIETIDYWFQIPSGKGKMRLHKYVHFYLMAYKSGDVRHHDDEVREARWFEIGQAAEALAFKSERAVVEKARQMLAKRQERIGS